MVDKTDVSSKELVELISSWLSQANPPALPANSPAELAQLAAYVQGLRQALAAFASGNIDSSIDLRGYVGGNLKALQANLRHLTWQARMVARGDLRQRVSFMGEFSAAFNEMVETLDRNMRELSDARDQLARLNEKLMVRIKRHEVTEDKLKRSENHFRHLAITDDLTQTITRQHFFVTAALELGRAIEGQGMLSLLMIDADRFKNINDTYGHLVGDQALRVLAGALRASLRGRDILARYGGEEFIVLLPNTNRKEALHVAERLRQAVAGAPVATEHGDIFITVSAGVVFFTAAGGAYSSWQIESLLLAMVDAADQALYEAKNLGRNLIKSGGPQDGDFSKLL